MRPTDSPYDETDRPQGAETASCQTAARGSQFGGTHAITQARYHGMPGFYMTPSGPTLTADSMQSIGRTLLRLVVVFGVVSTTMLTGGAAAEPATAGDALDDKKTAERLLGELEAMDSRPEVSVSQSAMDSVQYNVDRGNLAYTNENYAAAVDYYDAATEQARAELTEAYTAAAAVELQAADTRVAAVTDAGYQTETTATLQAQIEAERSQLDSVESYSEAAEAFEDAQTLREQAADLPTAESVSTADSIETIRDNLILIAGGGLVTGAGLGALGWYLYNTVVASQQSEVVRTH